MLVPGIGIPEIIVTLLYLGIPVLSIVVLYFVIRNAVAAGILRADKLREERDSGSHRA